MALHLDSYVNFHELNIDYYITKTKELMEKQDHIDKHIADIIMELIRSGQIRIRLVYDPLTEALTLSVTE